MLIELGGEIADIPGPEVTLRQIIKIIIENIKRNVEKKVRKEKKKIGEKALLKYNNFDAGGELPEPRL